MTSKKNRSLIEGTKRGGKFENAAEKEKPEMNDVERDQSRVYRTFAGNQEDL